MNLYRLYLLAILTLLFSIFCSAQNEQAFSEESYNRIETTTRISEFGQTGQSDRAARLDNFLIELQNNPGATGYIVFYQGKDVLPSQYDVKGEQLYLPHLKFRNHDQDGIVFVNAFRERQTTEFWVVPPGRSAPELTLAIAAPATPKNEAFLYHRSHFELSSDDFLLPNVMEERQIAIEEFSRDNAENLAGESLEEAGPEQRTEAAPRENDAENFYRSGQDFAEKVKNPESRGVIVFYVDDKMFNVAKIRDDIKKRIDGNAGQAKVNVNKFELVFGGYRSGIDIEMWVVPQNAKTPAAKPAQRQLEVS